MTSNNTQPQSPFLQFPGEIRNDIHEYLIRPRDIVYTPFTTHPTTHKVSRYTSDEYNSDIWSALGLSHTCRQLRAEFAPLQATEDTIIIHLESVNEYITTFIPDPARGAGCLLVRIPCAYLTMSLLPLIRLGYASPAIKIELTGTAIRGDVEDAQHLALKMFVDALLVLRRTRVWREYTRDAVRDVTVKHHERDGLSWCVEVKKGAKRDWMPWDVAVPRGSMEKGRWGAAMMWRMKVGLGGIMMPNVLVASE